MSDDLIEPSRFGTKGRVRYFTWSHIAYRLVWNTTWLLLASWTPPQLHAWRRFLLNLFGAKIAKGARVYGSARIWYPRNLTMEPHSLLGWKVNCYCMAPIHIEAHGEVAQFSHVVSGTHDYNSPDFPIVMKPVRIGAHAWIAANAFVGPGVTVGEGAVLGACGVAFRNLAPWTVYAGNPATEVKKRHNFTLD